MAALSCAAASQTLPSEWCSISSFLLCLPPLYHLRLTAYSFVLSYMNRGEVRHHLIRVVPGDDCDPCVFLDTRRDLLFHTIQDLVVYFTVFPIEDHVRLVFPENWKLHAVSGSLTDLTNVNLTAAPAPASGSAESLLSGPDSGVSSATSFADARPAAAVAPVPVRGGKRATFVPRKSADALSAYPDMQHADAHPRLDALARASTWLQIDVPSEKALGTLKIANGSFVVRKSNSHFATLSFMYNGMLRNVHIEATPLGLHLKHSPVHHESLSALIQYYVLPRPDMPTTLQPFAIPAPARK
eukprot:m.113015 g.113015  ORF g.113015 m.113015 type:complete len:299 (-) comp14382_c0_seq5:292-1188(-)